MNLIMNSNVETLVTLAKYFRGAMMDETKLPENAVTMPQLIKVNGFKMMKVSDKAKHYHDVVDEIEKSLEAYALQLNALMPQAINSQTKIDFSEKKSEPARVKTTETKKTESKKPVVDAETNIKKEKKSEDVAEMLIKKDSDPKLPIYGSLSAIPAKVLKAEDADSIVKDWTTSKGPEAKAKIYNKVRDLLNNYDMPVHALRKDVHNFVKKHTATMQSENEAQFQKELDEAGITFDTTTDLSKITSGEKLTTGKVSWMKKDSDEFNILLLTDSDDEDKVDPQNYVKLWAIYHRVIGDERQAIDILTKFYSDSEKGTIWSADKARWFLNNLFRVNAFKELTYAVENMLITKHEQGNYKDAIPFAKSFLINYTKHTLEVTRTINGKKTKVKETKHWPMHKVDNFINRAVTGLRMSKLLEASSPTFVADYGISKDGKFSGTIGNGKTKVKISNYNNFKDFEKACNVIALNQAQMVNKKLTEKDVTITYNKLEDLSKGKDDKKVSTKSTAKKGNVPKDKVAVQTRSTNNVVDKAKTAVTKTVNVVKNTVNKDVKKDKAGSNTKNQTKGAKQAKNASQTPSTKSNVKDKNMPAAKPTNQPQYSAIITLEKDKTYSCVINGFNEAVKTTGAKSIEAAKADFIEALRKYNLKVMEENDKARATYKKGKGKMLHMKPDFTEGELTFMFGEKKKTGTNG